MSRADGTIRVGDVARVLRPFPPGVRVLVSVDQARAGPCAIRFLGDDGAGVVLEAAAGADTLRVRDLRTVLLARVPPATPIRIALVAGGAGEPCAIMFGRMWRPDADRPGWFLPDEEGRGPVLVVVAPIALVDRLPRAEEDDDPFPAPAASALTRIALERPSPDATPEDPPDE